MANSGRLVAILGVTRRSKYPYWFALNYLWVLAPKTRGRGTG